ncbi:hypothetical protein ACTXMK_05290 [Psychrobacter celer]|uniref:hypothetical protein n=1 Tax=Psychrobacter celer TaxID=306572 RepID=UPI003FD3DE1C
MGDKDKMELDEFACIHCDHRYVRHQLRETFCENCDEVLRVKKLDPDLVSKRMAADKQELILMDWVDLKGGNQ